MRNLVIIIILLGMGYFAYQAFHDSTAVNTESANQRAIRENHLEDFEDQIPAGSQEALVEVDTEISGFFDGFFGNIMKTIRRWRIEVNVWIDAHL